MDKNQSSGGVLLSDVLMPYRSVENETTGYCPNYLMLGKTIGTPLDIVWNVIQHEVNANNLVKELVEKKELAYSIVKGKSIASMHRQKSQQDMKLSSQTFKNGMTSRCISRDTLLANLPSLHSFGEENMWLIKNLKVATCDIL